MYDYFVIILCIICIIGWDSYKTQKQETLGYKKNLEFKKRINQIIFDYERTFQDNTPSCRQEMMDIINPMLDNSIDLFKTWKKKYDNSYPDDSLAYIAVYTAAFDIVTNSSNHIDKGIVDYSGIANHAEKILHKCLDYFISEKIITEEIQQQELSDFQNCIEEYNYRNYRNHESYEGFYLYQEVIYNHFPEKTSLIDSIIKRAFY